MLRRTGQIIIAIISMFLLDSTASAVQTTYPFNATGDTFLKGFLDGHQDDNEGSNVSLRIQHIDRFSNVLVKFSESEILAAIGTGHVVSAKLELYIETNFSNWGSGAYVDAHRMSVDWNEMGATWNCPIDTNTANTSPDCEELWAGGYYEGYVSDSLLHQNSQLGWKSYDVTSDVQLIQNGFTSYGWLSANATITIMEQSITLQFRARRLEGRG